MWFSGDGMEQFFDLDADPGEEHNLIDDAASQEQVSRWRDRLVEALADREEGFVSDGKLVQRFLGLRTTLNAVAISPDGRRVATGGSDHVVRVWDVYTSEEVLALKGHTQAVAEVKFTADGTALMSRGGTDEWKLWDARPGDR